MSNDLRIQQALEKAEANILYLSSLPDKKLALKLDTVHLQMKLAEEKKNTSAIELLEIWRSQIIEARIYKAENRIPDAPDEIELAIAGIETIVDTGEQRAEKFNPPPGTEGQPRPKTQNNEDDSQLSLF